MEQSRWKSPVLWASAFGLIYFIAKQWFGFDIPGWNDFVALISSALLALGVINNPTDAQKL
jgi:uncharacterized membrane protein